MSFSRLQVFALPPSALADTTITRFKRERSPGLRNEMGRSNTIVLPTPPQCDGIHNVRSLRRTRPGIAVFETHGCNINSCPHVQFAGTFRQSHQGYYCLLYTSDAAD